MPETQDSRIDKRRVTMRSVRLLPNGETATEEATDFVPEAILDTYVSDARSRWQYVEVSDDLDDGPGGEEGATSIPRGLAVPDAGVVYPARGAMAKKLAANAGKGLDKNSGVEEPTMMAADWSLEITDCPAPDEDLPGFLEWHRTKFGATEMIANTAMRNTLADAYKAAATYADLYSTSGASAAGTAISGGSPAYASKALTWGSSSGGVVSTTATVFDIPSGATVAGFGVKTGAGGTYLDGGALTSQAFASQGTYTLTLTYTQT